MTKKNTLSRACKIIALNTALLFSGSMLYAQGGAMPTKIRALDAYQRYKYAVAAKLFEAMPEKQKADTLILRKLADSYAQLNEYDNAIRVFDKLVKMPEASAMDLLNYGDILKSAGKYEEAAGIYKQYEEKSSSQVSDKIKGCLVNWNATRNNDVQMVNYASLNTVYSDWGAINYPGNGLLYVSDSIRANNYTSGRYTSKDDGRTERNFEKLQVERNGQNDKAKKLLDVTAAFRYHTGPVAFTANFDTAYFTVTNIEKIPSYVKYDWRTKLGDRRLMLYMSYIKDNKWQPAVPFEYNKPELYSVGHAAISKDGSTLYFVSDMPGGYGGSDIWYCQKEGNKWSEPKNCGKIINTTEDEAFPSIGDDGTFYFASKGHIGMGGYDIFQAEGEAATWKTVQNMQLPINSPGDDFGFTTAGEDSAWLSSNRPGGKGNDDIYTVTGYKTKKINVVVLNKVTQQRLQDVAVDLRADNKNKQGLTNDNGVFTHSMNYKNGLEVSATKSGYLPAKVNVSTANVKDTVYVMLQPEIKEEPKKPTPEPEKPKAQTIETLREESYDRFQVNYDFDKSAIRSKDMAGLNRMIGYLKADPTLIAVVASFTDCKGSKEYNLKLSQRRSESIRKYLEDRGIQPERINTQFFGKDHPLLSCEQGYDVNAQETNRRSELILTRDINKRWSEGLDKIFKSGGN